MVFKNKVFNGFQSQVEEHLVFVKIDYFVKTMSLTSVPPSGRTPELFNSAIEARGNGKGGSVKCALKAHSFFPPKKKAIYIQNNPPQRPHRKSGQRCGPAAININRKNCEDLERQTKHEFYFVVGRIHETFFCS